MRRALRKLYLNPAARVVVFLLLLALGFTVWDALSQIDWTAYKAPAVRLPAAITLNVAFSPKGDRLAGCSEAGTLYVASLDLSAEKATVGSPAPIALPKDAQCAAFSWGPDGREIAMPYVTNSEDVPGSGLLLIRAEGGRPAQVIHLAGGIDPAVLPAWSPDGRSIAYFGGKRSQAFGGLWRLSLATPQRPERLRLGVIPWVAASPSGSLWTFAEDTAIPPHPSYSQEMEDWPHIWTIGTVPAPGAPVQRIARWTQGTFMPTYSAVIKPLNAGVRYVRYSRSVHGSRLEIWDAPYAGGPSIRRMVIALEVGHRPRDLRWSADGGRLVYLDVVTDAGPNTPKLADLQTGKVRSIIAGAGAPDMTPRQGQSVGLFWSRPALDPGGKWLAVSVMTLVQAPPSGEDDEDEDEGPQLQASEDTRHAVLLRLP